MVRVGERIGGEPDPKVTLRIRKPKSFPTVCWKPNHAAIGRGFLRVKIKNERPREILRILNPGESVGSGNPERGLRGVGFIVKFFDVSDEVGN